MSKTTSRKGHHIERRKDVYPKRGKYEYGNVKFADPVNNKYPIDTPKHIRAAWSYINHPKDRNAITRLVNDPCLVHLASQHGKTPAQVVLRWHLQHGVSAIPKSVHADRIAQNIDIFGFELDDTDMAAIDRLDTGQRAGGDPDLFDASRTTVRLDDGEQGND